ncbi:MAG: deoxyribodipyrimidine photo-lyase [Chloroflexi bacterium]|nr:deoxyribodipyrimidine photo-lyase [Chloroflexota bacterium]
MRDSPVLFWFRRDLRLDDNIGLHEAIRSGQTVLPVFIVDPRLHRGEWFSRNRTAFLFKALAALDARLRRLGANLLIFEGDPRIVLPALVDSTSASAIFFNRDYTPFAITRDDETLQSLSVPVRDFDDSLLIPPGNLLKDDGTAFKVFTAFHRRWETLPKPPVSTQDFRADHFCADKRVQGSEILRHAEERVKSHVPLPPADEDSAMLHLSHFVAQHLADYQSARNNLPLVPFAARRDSGPSCLSHYLRLGILSPRQVYWAAREAYSEAMVESDRQSIESFCRQIGWRDFFMHIMFHFPHVRHGNFRRGYDNLGWRTAPAELAAWQEGRTGYPIVDAAMRQLSATGWMPNRARMFTASFLTKHLLINWRAGEAHFMRHLLDGDPAANNGGWQWSAGTGTDAQPFFRIFNPVLQSRRYDGDGRYIRHWLPELKDFPDQFIHEPWRYKAAALDYPPPVVNHQDARQRALAAFQMARAKSPPDQDA